MSTANNDSSNNSKKPGFSAAPWKEWENDWGLYLGFLYEANKYCDGHNQTFTAVVENLIEKAKEGVNLFGDILASSFRITPTIRRVSQFTSIA